MSFRFVRYLPNQTKQYEAVVLCLAAKAAGENLDTLRNVYEQSTRTADSDSMSLFLSLQDLKYITAWNSKTIIRPDTCKYCLCKDCKRHNADADALPQSIENTIEEFFKEKK